MLSSRRPPLALLSRRPSLALVMTLIALLLAGAGTWLLSESQGDLRRTHTVAEGVPLDEVHPPGPGRRPGVIVAHGFAGSAKLMSQFGDTLAAQGYVVVLPDFAGHGANTRPLRNDGDSAALQTDLGAALAHLRALPDVDPARIALVGHSMGAGAVTRFAAAHPEITATVAISLPDASTVTPPARLLLLVGGLEFSGFRTAARDAGGTPMVIPGVEHISILYAPRTHRETARWLNDSFALRPATAPLPSPVRRVCGAGLLLVAFMIGLCPVARLALGPGAARGPRPTGPPALRRGPAGALTWGRILARPPHLGRVLAVAAVAAVVAMGVAGILPTDRIPLAVGGYVAVFTAVAGALMLAYLRWRGHPAPTAGPEQPRGFRLVAAPVLIGYAAATIAVPLQLGLTHVVPVGARWWLLAVVWAGFAALAYAAERLAGGNSLGVLAVSAVAVVVLTWAAVLGLPSGFLLLVVPLLAVLLLGQAIWSAVLHRFAAPTWLIAGAGSLLVAWPIATALPIVG